MSTETERPGDSAYSNRSKDVKELIDVILKQDFYTRQAIERDINESSLFGSEAELVNFELVNLKNCLIEESDIPISKEDTIVKEMSFKYGRSDIVIFHIDGSATVIEAKDGMNGYRHVVSGIGQVSLYASQLINKKVSLKVVRRALLWSSSGDMDIDNQIAEACRLAGVISMVRLPIKEIKAIYRLSNKLGSDGIDRIQKKRKEAINAFCDAAEEVIAELRDAR